MTINDIKTPCFVLEQDKLLSNVRSFKAALDSRFPKNQLGYSVKTNSAPVLLSLLKDEGCFAEVVSYNEYNLAKAKGFQASQIVYNGPLKDRETFKDAIVAGAYVNIDTKRELEWLKDLPKDKKYGVGLRLILNLMEISPEDCKDGEMYSRFGFSDENSEFSDALGLIAGLGNVEVVGLHLHRTSKTRSLQVYRNICTYALRVIEKYGIEPQSLDLGGGYYGDMPGKPTYQDYVDVIADTLAQRLDTDLITIILEPGNALIASPFTFYSSVIDTKYIGSDRIVVIDGSRNDIDPFFHKTDYFKTVITDMLGRNFESRQVVIGCTCLENDRLFLMTDSPVLCVGDVIRFSFVGAYTLCLSPLFSRYFPNIYLQIGDTFELSRPSWTEKDYLQSDN